MKTVILKRTFSGAVIFQVQVSDEWKPKEKWSDEDWTRIWEALDKANSEESGRYEVIAVDGSPYTPE